MKRLAAGRTGGYRLLVILRWSRRLFCGLLKGEDVSVPRWAIWRLKKSTAGPWSILFELNGKLLHRGSSRSCLMFVSQICLDSQMLPVLLRKANLPRHRCYPTPKIKVPTCCDSQNPHHFPAVPSGRGIIVRMIPFPSQQSPVFTKSSSSELISTYTVCSVFRPTRAIAIL